MTIDITGALHCDSRSESTNYVIVHFRTPIKMEHMNFQIVSYVRGMIHMILPISYGSWYELHIMWIIWNETFKTVVMLFLSPHMILRSESEYENAGISARQSFWNFIPTFKPPSKNYFLDTFYFQKLNKS